MKRLSLVMLAAIIAMMSLLSSSTRPTNAQNPTATPTAAATDDVDIQPANPTATPKTPAIKNPPSGTPQPTFKAPKSLDELRSTYPDLGPFIDKYKDAKVGDIDMTELYEKITTIFNSEGAAAVGTFLEDSGLLEKLNIPLSYVDLLTAYDQGGLDAVSKLAHDRQIINRKDELAGYLTLDDEASVPAETTRLEGLGVTVYKFNQRTDELEIGVPLSVIAQFQTPGKLLSYLTSIADSEHVEGFRPPYVAASDGMNFGAAKGNGAQLIGADKWHDAGITGKGVKVGILDIGFGGVKEALGNTLPENVTTNLDIDELDAQDVSHGTAVAEIVHSIAPDAELYLAYMDLTSYDSILEAMDFLQKNEVQVMNHSVNGVVGPRDGKWGMAELFEAYIRDTGVLMTQSAGNARLSHSMFKFNPGEKNLHLFGTTDDGTEVYAMPIVPFTEDVSVIANWNGNWDGKEKSQYNVIVLDEDGKEVAVGNEPRKGKKADFPFQAAPFTAEEGKTYYAIFQRARGTEDNVLDVFVQGGEVAEWAQVTSYTVTSPGDADSLLTVGAVGLEGDEQETYSSEGPTLDDRIKPDIAAPTGDITSTYPDGFFGTSGSAPVMAGAAALVLQANPDMSYSEVKAWLMENIIDLGDEGEDNKFGTGRLQLPEPDASNNDDKTDNGDDDKNTGDDNTDDNGNNGDDNGNNNDNAPAVVTITDVNAKFGVKVGKLTGLQVTTSFDLENFEGDKLIVGALFYDTNGKAIPSADENYEVNGTIAAATTVEPSSDSTAFEDITLFIPNAVFKKVIAKEILCIVVVIDPAKEGEESLLGHSEAIKIKVTKK